MDDPNQLDHLEVADRVIVAHRSRPTVRFCVFVLPFHGDGLLIVHPSVPLGNSGFENFTQMLGLCVERFGFPSVTSVPRVINSL